MVYIKAKPYSINQLYYGNRRHGKTREAQDWSLDVLYQLSQEQNKQILEQLRNSFNAKEHGFSVTLEFGVPEYEYYTKQGTISSKTVDLSNCEKAIIDLIFLPKHYGEFSNGKAPNLNTDDKYIIELSSKKVPAKESYIKALIKLVPNR